MLTGFLSIEAIYFQHSRYIQVHFSSETSPKVNKIYVCVQCSVTRRWPNHAPRLPVGDTVRVIMNLTGTWLSGLSTEFKSSCGSPGGTGWGHSFYPSQSTLLQTRPFVRHAPKCVRTLKIPYPSVAQEQASAGGVGHTTYSMGMSCCLGQGLRRQYYHADGGFLHWIVLQLNNNIIWSRLVTMQLNTSVSRCSILL